MSDLYKIYRTFQISPKIAIHKFTQILLKKTVKSKSKQIDDSKSTYFNYIDIKEIKINNILKYPKESYLLDNSGLINKLSSLSITHKFDLLGSGFVYCGFAKPINEIEELVFSSDLDDVNIDNFADKLINESNKSQSKDYLALLKKYNPNYKLIDWQRDHKSGYRWSESTYHKMIKYGNNPPADVKMPWELGRMQDLIMLANSYKIAKLNKTDSDKYIMEFICRTIDFVASNPPKYGVQWVCAMDVSIRVINMLTAYDLFTQSGIKFTDEFSKLFNTFIFEHIDFIENNLEWSSGMRGNHYFTNITGLLGAYVYILNADNKSELLAKIAKLLNTIAEETLHQFNEDGSNFEASLPYHFLCTEMLLYSMIFIDYLNTKNIKSEELSKSFFIEQDGKIHFSQRLSKRINSIFDFTYAILDSNNYSYNIGDNDSGKFIKFMPYHKIVKDELVDDLNNYSQIVHLMQLFTEKSVNNPLQNEIREIIELSSSISLMNRIHKYEDFGLYLYQNDNYSACFRCGNIGQNSKGGHSHNDQLSLTLKIDNFDFLVDNGTYVYTADPAMRNMYRSTFMHNTLSIDNIEQNDWVATNSDDLFWIKKYKSKAEVKNISINSIDASHFGFGTACNRIVKFYDSIIDIEDKLANDLTKEIHLYLNPEISCVEIIHNRAIIKLSNREIIISSNTGEIKQYNYLHSHSYGCLTEGIELRIISNEKQINWSIEIK